MNMNIGILLLSLLASCWSIGVPLHQGQRCMIIQGQMDPIKLEVKFPRIPNKEQGEKYSIKLNELFSGDNVFNVLLEEKTIYRKNLELSPKQMYAEYRADQDFDALIGTFSVPEELLGQANLQYIYNMSESINRLNKRVIENQAREREIQNSIAMSSLEKNQRITTLTFVECLVIVLSGAYQVMALRRFLIQKNLY